MTGMCVPATVVMIAAHRVHVRGFQVSYTLRGRSSAPSQASLPFSPAAAKSDTCVSVAAGDDVIERRGVSRAERGRFGGGDGSGEDGQVFSVAESESVCCCGLTQVMC